MCTNFVRIIGFTFLVFCSGVNPCIPATSTPATFSVEMTITASCTITNTSTLNFGNQTFPTSSVDQTATLQVQCTSGTPYIIAMDAGTASGATVTSRKMPSGPNTVNYFLFRDAGRTLNWGNTINSDTVSSTGNGAAQNHTIYGRVPAQTTPAPGTYSDTVTVTVEY